MGRIATIENTAASGLAHYDNLKIIVRGRPRYIDPQLDSGTLRFAVKRGFNFSAIIPDNQSEISVDAHKDTFRITMASRPSWLGLGTLIRLGNSEAIGELHLVRDIIDVSTIEVFSPLISNYSADPEQDIIPVVSLIGTPCSVSAPTGAPDDVRIMTIDSWYKIVPSDVLLLSSTPSILESLQEFIVRRAKLFSTRAGNTGIGEPPTVYQYHIELATNTGLLPFVPPVDHKLYLKALPLYFRGEWGTGDIEIPADVGPCVVDAFYGSLLNTSDVYTKLGIQTWDAFGLQSNLTPGGYPPPLYNVAITYSVDSFVSDGLGLVYKSLVNNNLGQALSDTTKWLKSLGAPQWQAIPENYLILERPISSDSLLFWQRITGNFQYKKNGFFQAELTAGDTIATAVEFTVNPISDMCTTAIPHGFITGEKTQVATSDSLPSGLLPATYYYVIVLSPTTFKLSDTLEHALTNSGFIDITSIGVGTHSCVDPNTGKFCFSTGLLVPKWPTDHEYGWVIPLFSRSDVTCVVQFEPQEQQVFKIPSNTLTFIRPHVHLIYETITTGTIPLIEAGDTTVTTGISFTVDPSTDICTAISHGFTTGLKVQLFTSGALPGGLFKSQTYYVVNIYDGFGAILPDVFKLSDTLAHALAGTNIIDITSLGVGTHRCSDFSVNFVTAGVEPGQLFSISGTMLKITTVTANKLTVADSFPTTTTSVAYQILQQDLTPIDRMLISFKGSPNSRVEIRDWQYDGTMVTSLSYYILGTGEAYGQKRWLAGGFSVKPLFYNFAVLRARYSDGVSRYNAGHTYV